MGVLCFQFVKKDVKLRADKSKYTIIFGEYCMKTTIFISLKSIELPLRNDTMTQNNYENE